MKPIFRTSQTTTEATKLFVQPRAYVRRMTKTQKWVGVSSGLVRRDKADDRMLVENYGAECGAKCDVTDAVVDAQIKALLAAGVTRFEKRTVTKRSNEELQTWITLAVYESEDDRVLLVDTAFASPQVLFAAKTGPMTQAVDANVFEDVTIYVAPYLDEDTIAQMKKQLQRRR